MLKPRFLGGRGFIKQYFDLSELCFACHPDMRDGISKPVIDDISSIILAPLPQNQDIIAHNCLAINDKVLPRLKHIHHIITLIKLFTKAYFLDLIGVDNISSILI